MCRCRYAKICRLYRKDAAVCQDDEQAAHGAGGEPYCGAFRAFFKLEKKL